MKILDLLKKEEAQASALPSALAVSLATLSARHLNAARDIMSKKEQQAARQAVETLSAARKQLHGIERALKLRDQEQAMRIVGEASNKLQEYCRLTAPIVKLEQVRNEVGVLKQKLAELEKAVVLDRV